MSKKPKHSNVDEKKKAPSESLEKSSEGLEGSEEYEVTYQESVELVYEHMFEFVTELKRQILPEKKSYLVRGRHSYYAELNNLLISKADFKVIDAASVNSSKKEFDFIFVNLPSTAKKTKDKARHSSVHYENWEKILALGGKLSNEGRGIFIVEAKVWSMKWRKFATSLRDKGVYVDAYVQIPPSLEAYTLNRFKDIVMLVISKKMKSEKSFYSAIDGGGFDKEIVDNLVDIKNSRSSYDGLWVSEDEFSGFYSLIINDHINNLKTKFKEYKQYKLVDLAREINAGRTKKRFAAKDNAVYVPKLGTSDVVLSVDDVDVDTGYENITLTRTINHQNYFQVVLDDSIVLNRYAAMYLNSEIGRLSLEAIQSGAVIKSINKSRLEMLQVAVPNKKEQKLIATTDDKLKKLRELTTEFGKSLSLNPRNAQAIQEKLDSALEAFSALNVADRVLSIIRKGESKTVEFKETFSLNTTTNSKLKDLEKASLKTLVGLLNTDGGVLLIGVKDDGTITGLDDEVRVLYKANDKLMLHIKDMIKSSIGEDFYPYIETKTLIISDKLIVMVEVEKSQKPCYYQGKEFYVRTNPATDQLEGPKLVNYIGTHFG